MLMRCRIGPCEAAARATDFRRPCINSTFHEYFGRRIIIGISL
jgi:hypothetical protein